MNTKEFVHYYFAQNKNNNCILSKEEIYSKINSRINGIIPGLGGYWSIFNDEKLRIKISLNAIADRIIFGFSKSFLFTEECLYYIVLPSTLTLNMVWDLRRIPYTEILKSVVLDQNSAIIIYSNEKLVIERSKLLHFEDANSKNSSKGAKISHEIFDLAIDFLRELKQFESRTIQKQINEESERKSRLVINKMSAIQELDKNNDGRVDIINSEDFYKLLSKYQKEIISIDKDYIQKFVKISQYLKTKEKNLEVLFKSISEISNEVELNNMVHLLKNQIHTYEVLSFHSINMLVALVNNDLITFYEVYECLDQLGVFNSNWENEVSKKLTNIGQGIKDLMYAIDRLEENMINSIDNLSYLTQDSFGSLKESVENHLYSINSSIKFNTLLTGIQAYQLHRLSKNFKSIT